jgi:hypothetical protein
VLKFRPAASAAIPAPFIPPPITSRSTIFEESVNAVSLQ